MVAYTRPRFSRCRLSQDKVAATAYVLLHRFLRCKQYARTHAGRVTARVLDTCVKPWRHGVLSADTLHRSSYICTARTVHRLGQELYARMRTRARRSGSCTHARGSPASPAAAAACRPTRERHHLWPAGQVLHAPSPHAVVLYLLSRFVLQQHIRCRKTPCMMRIAISMDAKAPQGFLAVTEKKNDGVISLGRAGCQSDLNKNS
jgi:hypothetical protein